MHLLTHTEAIIAGYLAQGLNRNEIAKLMGCSINTIKTHCLRMFRKLEVNNKTCFLNKIREEETESSFLIP